MVRTLFINDKQKLRGFKPQPPKDIMQTVTHSKPAKALSRPSSPKKPRQPGAQWTPQPSGLSRDEIRAIIIDQIG